MRKYCKDVKLEIKRLALVLCSVFYFSGMICYVYHHLIFKSIIFFK